MTFCTPMGPAAPGSRLERRGEGERIVNHLIQAGWRLPYLAEELGVSVISSTSGATARACRLRRTSSKRSASTCATERLSGPARRQLGAGWLNQLGNCWKSSPPVAQMPSPH